MIRKAVVALRLYSLRFPTARFRPGPARLALAAALLALAAVPCWSSLFDPIQQPGIVRRQCLDHLVIDLPRAPSGPGDPIIGYTIRQTLGDRFSRLPAYAAFLARRGRLAPSWRPQLDAAVALRVGGRTWDPALTRAARAYGGGAITFAFSGWTSIEQRQLAAYVNAVYPVIVSIYGAPAATITVTIVRDANLQNILGGVYVPPTNEIRIPPLQDLSRDTYVLAALIVRAFHDEVALGYDAWETGFARAVALVGQLQVDASFDLSSEPYYLLPAYDLLNQRPLASPNFFPASGFIGMSVWRIAMAQAAWLKVYAENPSFFRDFNAAYYAEYSSSLPTNITRLRQLAAAAAPQVEGMLFQDWCARQFVLDTRGWPGEKLYLVALPQLDNVTVYLEAEYYRATAAGDEQPLAGTGNLQYIAWDGHLLYPEAGTSIAIQSGQGFLSPSFIAVGGAQRITIELAVGAQVVDTWFPYGVAATGGARNSYFGLVLDADGGTINVAPPGVPTPTVNAVRGVFTTSQTTPLNFFAPTAVEYQPLTGLPNSRSVNTGPLYYILLLRAHPLQLGAVTHTFPAGMSLISLPHSPGASDAAQVLGLSPSQTLLARWSPTLAGGYRYIFYPDTPPFEPGLGYWLNAVAPLTVTSRGLLPTGEWRLHLRQGWNQVANPFAATVPLSGVTVKLLDAAPVSLTQAQSRGVVGGLFRYVNGSYVAAQDLPPFEGLWIYAYPADGCWLIIQQP